MEGKFITFEGIDGSGKTSVLKGVIEHLNDKRIIIFGLENPVEIEYQKLSERSF